MRDMGCKASGCCSHHSHDRSTPWHSSSPFGSLGNEHSMGAGRPVKKFRPLIAEPNRGFAPASDSAPTPPPFKVKSITMQLVPGPTHPLAVSTGQPFIRLSRICRSCPWSVIIADYRVHEEPRHDPVPNCANIACSSRTPRSAPSWEGYMVDGQTTVAINK